MYSEVFSYDLWLSKSTDVTVNSMKNLLEKLFQTGLKPEVSHFHQRGVSVQTVNV